MSSKNNDVDALLNGVEGAEEPSAELKARGKMRLLATIGGATIGVASASVASASTGGSVAGSASVGTGVAGAATGTTAAGAAGATLSIGGSVGGGLALSGAALAKPLAVLLLVGGAAFSVPWTNISSDVSAEPPLSAVEPRAVEPRAVEPRAVEPSAPQERAGETRGAETPNVIADAPLPAEFIPGEELPQHEHAPAWVQESIGNVADVRPVEVEPARSHSAPTPARSVDTDDGATLLRRAITLQHSGDHAGALRTANTHRARFPNSMLRVEREAVAIGALCQLGRDAEARVREQTIHGEQEATYLSQRIRQFCD